MVYIFDKDATICQRGQILPIFPSERLWDPNYIALVYGILLAYLFVGISIVADVFMASIEVITSKKKIIKIVDHNVSGPGVNVFTVFSYCCCYCCTGLKQNN